jgi:hypothetical protein
MARKRAAKKCGAPGDALVNRRSKELDVKENEKENESFETS